MKNCYIEFIPKDNETLARTVKLFELIKQAKENESCRNEEQLAGFLNEDEKRYFWFPTSQEVELWKQQWFSTPVDKRDTPKLRTRWIIESMFEAFWNGDYELLAIQEENNNYYLTFNPFGFPYGGVECMIAFIECFGHTVIGTDDGSEYRAHIKVTEYWSPGLSL